MEKIIDKASLVSQENEKFIANILHDIKSPLYSIKIGLSPHLDNDLNNDIFETVVGILDYIENFLVNYNFKTAKFENRIEKCDIKEIICKKIKSYKNIFINKNIYIDIFSPDEDYRVNSIPVFLSSIIGNLISNVAFHAKECERASIEIYKKQNYILAEIKNYYCEENSNFSLGLDFCRNLAKCCKTELKFVKTKSEVRVSLKIPNLN